MMDNPLVSVIIPCYNHGAYLETAIDSVLRSDYNNYEIIVINDGSTDNSTLRLLKNIRKPNTHILHTENKGVANARNSGIAESKGKYILPLDADDKISSKYITEAVKVLEADLDVGIVYSKARLFGKKVGEWNLPSYSIERILASNIIFCSAFFRKEGWKKVNGYKPDIPYGKEDWEFWLSLIESGANVYCLPETHFYYRIKTVSRDTMAVEGDKRKIINAYIYSLHKELYNKYLSNPLQLYQENIYLKTVLDRPEYKFLRKVLSPTIHFVKKVLKKP